MALLTTSVSTAVILQSANICQSAALPECWKGRKQASDPRDPGGRNRVSSRNRHAVHRQKRICSTGISITSKTTFGGSFEIHSQGE
jgi:hypothetical protein